MRHMKTEESIPLRESRVNPLAWAEEAFVRMETILFFKRFLDTILKSGHDLKFINRIEVPQADKIFDKLVFEVRVNANAFQSDSQGDLWADSFIKGLAQHFQHHRRKITNWFFDGYTLQITVD